MQVQRVITSCKVEQVISTSLLVNVGCTKNIKLISPNFRATGNLFVGRQPVPSKAFSR
jgi:hypothetical protein